MTRLPMLMVALAVSVSAQTSFWLSSAVPVVKGVTNDANSVTLGLKFTTTTAGSITAVRFYKGTKNTGTHVGTLWSSTGTKLASVTFSGETTSGWQQTNFPTPIQITANTVYTIAYLAPKGTYADDEFYNWAGLTNTYLRTSGTNPGVFAYGTTTTFPTGTWNSSNYWVDLVFLPNTTPPPSTYSITGVVSGTSAATLALSGTATRTVGTDSVGNYVFSNLVNGNYTVTPSASGYSFSPTSTSVTVNGANVTGANFTATSVPPPPPPPSHSVDLTWTASTTPTVVGYRVWRGTTSGGPYTALTSGNDPTTAYTDATVSAGLSYYYVTTAVDGNGVESAYSNQAVAVIPNP